MFKLIRFFGLFLCFHSLGLSQCAVSAFIEDNYRLDAQILTLREIRSDPQDPDYNNPFIPEARITPFLEKLSAIHANPNSIPIIDSIFDELQIHINIEIWEPVGYNGISFKVNTSVSWVQTLKDTGVSGYSPLDNFLETYQLHLYDFWDLSSQGTTIFFMSTDFDFLNTYALEEELGSINDILSTNVACYEDCPLWLNYAGVPYLVYDESNKPYIAQACDISGANNRYIFKVAGGDCLAGCLASKEWIVEVSEDCSSVVLNTSEKNTNAFTLYPNPSSETIHIRGVTSEIKHILIYSVAGQFIQSVLPNSDKINISNLQSGIYFLKIITSEGNKQIQKFIKH
ncbi:MAG: T9SS type A sorting domain-containing protein [Bacteroidota bacterium]